MSLTGGGDRAAPDHRLPGAQRNRLARAARRGRWLGTVGEHGCGVGPVAGEIEVGGDGASRKVGGNEQLGGWGTAYECPDVRMLGEQQLKVAVGDSSLSRGCRP